MIDDDSYYACSLRFLRIIIYQTILYKDQSVKIYILILVCFDNRAMLSIIKGLNNAIMN